MKKILIALTLALLPTLAQATPIALFNVRAAAAAAAATETGISDAASAGHPLVPLPLALSVSSSSLLGSSAAQAGTDGNASIFASAEALSNGEAASSAGAAAFAADFLGTGGPLLLVIDFSAGASASDPVAGVADSAFGFGVTITLADFTIVLSLNPTAPGQYVSDFVVAAGELATIQFGASTGAAADEFGEAAAFASARFSLTQAVPEPSSLALLLVVAVGGGAGLRINRRRS